MKIEMPIPSIAERQAFVLQVAIEVAIASLQENLNAPRFSGQTELDENQHSRNHLLREFEGCEPPPLDLIDA